jgi:GNAT superfamily N-acetyltransferase
MITLRQITDPVDSAIARFGALQERTYADGDMLIPPAYLGTLLARSAPDRQNLMLVAEMADQVVGGVVFHYFPHVNTGFSSYMAVEHAVRGQGLARRIHEARFALLDQVAGVPVHGIFIDVVAPERLTAAEIAHEQTVGADPWLRRQIFKRLGFRRVAVDYYQPPDGPGAQPITSMDLLYCPHPGEQDEVVSTELVVRTMHIYWAPWLGRAAADTHAAELRRRCGGAQVALYPC